ncbi:DUF6095 family protein [Aequorivita viscosa]|uniref:Uncharacterized protein n=1 Tax=Aequorivita viscosa TaxID=797419 RepID=A0A1M6NUA1_9FLAO|nr:DUF6095 family protein [Aequorivita viscosa]SDX48600.1 hypothetical protein SAMN05216556_1363 [Aequorivita viscosa]SHJ99293.1 hypothetical protein SAMN04487908_1391 [Aequorivita viscosa]
MGKDHTDFNILKKGLKYLAFALPLLFLSPYLLTLSFLNKDTYIFFVFLFPAILAGAGAIYLCFKGINTIMKSIF